MLEFTIHAKAIAGCLRWNYSANGYPIGQVYKYTDSGCGHDFCAKPLHSKKVWRFSTFAKADSFLKDTCK